MSKVANTYWDNSTVWTKPKKNAAPRKKQFGSAKSKTHTTPKWFGFAVVSSITFMLCLTINFRAFSEMSHEMSQNETLTQQVETLTNENLLLQEDIHGLKSDTRAIEREARKIGLGRPNEKILVPTK
ncbi:MAG TPA: septum formation initiator family protein [Pyrinomonadaceae bacterium]|nr:septum formation initiator family protein [Pyrinomonadaceae bacterium]